MINGVGVVIFNDANVMTTDDIVTSCQRDRTPTSPASAGRGVGMSRILVGTGLCGGHNMPPDWKTGVLIFNDDIVTSCQRSRAQPVWLVLAGAPECQEPLGDNIIWWT